MSAWANRRAAVQAETDALQRAEDDAALAEQQAELAEKPEAEVLAELNLPNPDEMSAGDDFSGFMKSAVPTALRNRALRKLWLTNPALANVDMLVDYGEDFTGKGDVIGAIKTIYRVGKGMLPDEPETMESTVLKPVVEPEEDEAFDTEPEVPVPVAALAAPAEAMPPALAPRRRMRFEFAEAELPAPNGTE